MPSYPTPDRALAALPGRQQASRIDRSPTGCSRRSTTTVGKGERYYQQIAINRAVEAILNGQRRLLLTMATGTGKTAVAFQICWKLWNARWNRTGEHRRPRSSTSPTATSSSTTRRTRSSPPSAMRATRSKPARSSRAARCTSPSTRPSPRTSAAPGSSGSSPPDFFDLVIVDECHRGSARDDSDWREILEYFEPAFQLGMTATPLRDDNRDTYLYFGNPLYNYSLRQGIEDGFLAPYRVHRVITEWDAAGWRPSKDELDRYGRAIPDDEYQTKDFERVVALRARTEAIARHLTEFLKKTDRFAKTIVFCVDQEHADEMRAALDNLNADLVAAVPRLRLPRHRRRRRHRPRPPQPLPGRRDADARRSSPPRSCSPPASMRRPARTSCSPASSAR